MASRSMRVALVGALHMLLAAHGANVDVTPMAKVITLLGDLSTKVAAEGQEEAKQYDKFACFCKEQVTDKFVAIEKSNVEIDEFALTVGKLQGDIKALNQRNADIDWSEAKGLAKNVNKKIDMKKTRDKEHTDFVKDIEDMDAGITGVRAAIDKIQDSLGAQKKDWNAATDGFNLMQTLKKQHPAQVALLQKFTAGGSAGEDPKTTGVLVDFLQSKLLVDFKEQKQKVENSERTKKQLFDRDMLSMTNADKFAGIEVGENTQSVEEKSIEENRVQKQHDQEVKDRDADLAFKKELTKECENKAKVFDQRSKGRTDEITAITTAIDALKEGSKGKKFVQVSSPKSLLQLSRQSESTNALVLERVRSFLEDAGIKMKSDVLSTLAVQVQIGHIMGDPDHFVKVRGLIKDLMAKLVADAKNEATAKHFCDENMKSTLSDRDDAQAKVEKSSAEMSKLTSLTASLKQNIQDTSKAIAEDTKGLAEATELRAADKKTNTNTILDAKAAIKGIEMAMTALNNYYSPALIQAQAQAHNAVPGADRSGKTVANSTPEVAQVEYNGAQDSSKGIIGMLQVCQSDFQKALDDTESEEKESLETFEKYKEETEDNIKSKTTSKEDYDGELAKKEDATQEEKATLKEQKDLLAASLKTLESLKASCVEGGESFKDREKARQAEIASLKSAQAMLDDWKS